jgi:hypothetical protein
VHAPGVLDDHQNLNLERRSQMCSVNRRGLSGLALLAAAMPLCLAAPQEQSEQTSELWVPLHIICNPETLAVDAGTLTQLLNSEGIRSQIARTSAELGQPAPALSYVESTRLGRPLGDDGPPQETLIGFVCLRWAGKVETKSGLPMLRAATDALSHSLATLANLGRDHALIQVDLARKQVLEAEQELTRLHERQTALLAEAGVHDLSRERVLSLVRDLEGERDRTRMNLIGLSARREAVARHIAELSKQAQASSDAEGVIRELERIGSIRERLLNEAQALARQGAAAPDAVDRAAESLAQARAELARERRAVAQSPAGALAAEFNHELVRIAVEISEQEARLAFVIGRLSEIEEKKLIGLAGQYELMVVSRMPMAQQRLADANRQLQAAQRRLDSMRIPPMVKLIDE